MFKRIISVICLIAIVMSCAALAGSAAEKKVANKFNVVFVTDASGSMGNTDPNKYRYDAIDLFVGLVSNGGNYIGSVVFSDTVNVSSNVKEIKSVSDKQALSSGIQKQAQKGWTDIGGALTKAVEMLNTNGKKDRESIIILLTDGNTEMGDPKLTKESLNKKEDAMEAAVDKGYKIYTICLNKNKEANANELKQIAKATGGEFREVTNAADLKSVFDLYYQLIYQTNSEKLGGGKVPANGIIKKDFNVADAGVEEVNIAILGKVNKCKLVDPNGKTYSEQEVKKLSYITDEMFLIKVEKPIPGKWSIEVSAKPGTYIDIFKIYNSNLNVKASVKNAKDSYAKNKEIEVIAEIFEDSEKITDPARCKDYKAVLEITKNGKIVDKIESTTFDAEGFHLKFSLKDIGTYYGVVKVTNGEIYDDSEQLTFSIGNAAPKAVEPVFKKHINIWPFLIETDTTIDLSEAATDSDGDKLTYTVKNSTWLEEDYTVKDNTITIDNFSVSKGTFKVEAMDDNGAYCTFDVKVTSTNIGILTMILMIIAIVIVAIVIVVLIYYLANTPFMGTFTVRNLETGETNEMMKSKGQLKVFALNVGDTGFDKDAHFQATAKKYVYFKCKKPVESTGASGKSKKIKINSGREVRIFSNPEKTKGIAVTFKSMLGRGRKKKK